MNCSKVIVGITYRCCVAVVDVRGVMRFHCFTGEYGPRRPPWYIFMRSYWCDVSDSSGERLHLINGDQHPNNTSSHDEDVEPVSSDLHGKEGIR